MTTRSATTTPARAALVAAACLALPAAPAAALERAPGGPVVEEIATGLVIPWDVAFLPDGRALATERPGRVRVVDPSRRLQASPLATVPVQLGGDGGLLGVAADPAFGPDAPFVYMSYTAGGELRVGRWRLSGAGLGFEADVVRGIPTGSAHSSGRVRFGPDGAMYVGTGDGDEAERSQSPTSPAGKLLRVPAGAYRAGTVAPEIVALGLRHPQGLAWQPGSGRMFVTDHGPSGPDGPSGDDELDLITPGANHGWPRVRGLAHGGFTAPVHLWAETIAPASIAFVALPGSAWTGDALVTGLRGQVLRRLVFEGDRVVRDEPLFAGAYGRLRAVAETPDGAIWVTTSNRDALGTPRPGDDRILRIVPPAAPAGAPAEAPTAPHGAPATGSGAAPPGPAGAPARSRVAAGPGIRVLTAPATFTRRPAGPVLLERRTPARRVTVAVLPARG